MLGLKRLAVICAASVLLAGCVGGKSPQAQRKQPPKQGAVRKVLLIWQDPEWKVQLPGKAPVKPDQAKSKLDPNVGPTKFEVTFQGAGTGLTVFKDPDGLSIWEGSKTSPQSGVKSTQIIGPFVSKDGKMLVFYDLNYGDPVNLSYELMFNDKPKVDPIIENGGGSWQ